MSQLHYPFHHPQLFILHLRHHSPPPVPLYRQHGTTNVCHPVEQFRLLTLPSRKYKPTTRAPTTNETSTTTQSRHTNHRRCLTTTNASLPLRHSHLHMHSFRSYGDDEIIYTFRSIQNRLPPHWHIHTTRFSTNFAIGQPGITTDCTLSCRTIAVVSFIPRSTFYRVSPFATLEGCWLPRTHLLSCRAYRRFDQVSHNLAQHVLTIRTGFILIFWNFRYLWRTHVCE